MSYKPEGWPDLAPRIFVDDPEGLFVFLQKVFGAKAQLQPGAPIEARIGDSLVMLSDTSVREPHTACIYVYVADVAAAFEAALESGAEALEEPFDTPYGDRRAFIRDPWGNLWQMATHR